jgi:thiamine biosynthesis lipoprotein
MSFFVGGCTQKVESFTLSGETMGTSYHITIVLPPKESEKKLTHLKHLIDKELININQLMSTYISDSELSLFNTLPEGQWYDISAETLQVIDYSLYLSEMSGGKFDVTVSPLISLWGFGAKTRTHFPSDDDILQAKQRVGWRSVVLDKENQRIKKEKPLSINLSAIAKGYGVDHIALLLEEQGIHHYLVEIGGEIRVKGKNKKQQLWRIGVESPSFYQSGVQEIIQLNNKAIATSGDYRNFFERDGVRYSHTIDPETGEPVIHNIASITVLADSAMKADGLATAFMVMGEDKALALAKEYNIPVYILLYKNDTFDAMYSPSFATYLQ